MRVLILCAVFCTSFAAQAVEYGYFSRTHTSSNWSHSVALEEGDRIIFMNSDAYNGSTSSNTGRDYYVPVNIFSNVFGSDPKQFSLRISTQVGENLPDIAYFTYTPEDQRTLVGPGTIEPRNSNNGTYVMYKIIRAGEGESKFTVALNAQGTRMAIGNKSGTNGVARVFEFNGTDWEQLGSDVE